MNLLKALIILVVLFVIFNLSRTVYLLARKQVKEGMAVERKDKINCKEPASGVRKDKFMGKIPKGWDGDCNSIAGKFGKKVKLCGGGLSPTQIKKGHHAQECRKRWFVDSNGRVCNKSSTEYVEKHGKCPHLLGPGGKQHLLGPGGTQKTTPSGHSGKHSGRRVPDDSNNHKYKKFIPDDLDQLPLSKSTYEQIGRDFMKDEAKNRGITSPPIHDSEAEVLGKMVWRVYAAEIEQKRANSPKANDDVLAREIQLLNKVSVIMKSETGQQNGKKKRQTISTQASQVPKCGSRISAARRTNNMFGYTPPNKSDISREPGYAFEGYPLHGSPRYYDIANAVEHCEQDRSCGGVNFNSTTGEYTLMPIHARVVKRAHYTALIKKKHRRSVDPKSKHHSHTHTHKSSSDATNPYLPETGIGFSGNQNSCCPTNHPRNPNLKPRPYNSLMDLFR